MLIHIHLQSTYFNFYGHYDDRLGAYGLNTLVELYLEV